MLGAQMFVLIEHPDEISMKISGPRGEVMLQEAVYRPLIEAMAEDNYAPKTLGQLAGHAKLASLQHAQLLQALLVLVGSNHARPAQEIADKARQRCAALNRYICEQARSEGHILVLVSPLTGCGIAVGRAEQLFLLAARHGKKTASEKAAYVWEILSAQGQNLMKDGKMLETAAENIAELTQIATKFVDKRVPILAALGIV